MYSQPVVFDNMKEPGCCSKFLKSVVKEFHWENLYLSHYPVDDFYKSQWQRGGKSFWWLLYRWCAAGFFIAAVVSSAVKYWSGGKFFIYLTDWGLCLCMITTTYGAVLATMYYFCFAKRVDPVENSTSIKVFWALHSSTLVLATVITVMFWSFLFPEDTSMGGNPYNIMQHAMNSVVMLIDHMVVAFPTRLLHCIYPLGIGIIYMLFSLIYAFSGGTDPLGNQFIYPILDWLEAPGWAVASALGAVVLCIIFTFLLFWLYKLKEFLWKECVNARSPYVIPK